MQTYIGEVPGLGRGVFAARDLQQGEVIEVCAVLAIPPEQVQYLDKTGLHAYYYAWGHDLKGAAIALGHGSLYNHSYQPNARYLKHLENGTIEFICLNDVKKGEEIRVNYNGDPSDQTPTWFETS